MRKHPHTEKSIRLIEAKMAEVRKMKRKELLKPFDPRFCDPYQLNVAPSNKFQLKPQTVPAFSFAISDVHLSPEPHPSTLALLGVYRMGLDLGASFVDNGDHYDYFVWGSTRDKIRENNPELTVVNQRMSRILEVTGNHDQVLQNWAKPWGKIGPNVYVPRDGTFYQDHVYFEHGHQSDPYNAPGSNLGFYVVKVLTLIERMVRPVIPNFMRWMELGEYLWFMITAKSSWSEHKINEVENRVVEVQRNLRKRAQEEGRPFSENDPLIFVRGHDHGAGLEFTHQAVKRAVYRDPRLNKSVRYYSTGSWKDDESYFVVIDHSHFDREYAYPFVWKPIYGRLVAFKEEA